MGMSLVGYLANDVLLTVFVYLATYYLGRAHELPVLLGAMFLAQAAALPAYTWLGSKIGKSGIYIAGTVIWILDSTAVFFTGPVTPFYVLLILITVAGTGMAGLELAPHAMFGDVADVNELYYGDRREGILIGINNFISRAALAASSFILMLILGATGYREPVAQVTGGRLSMVGQAQPESAVLVMRISSALVPVILLTAGIFLAARYHISSGIHKRLSAFLEKRRKGLDNEAEENALRELL